MLRYVLDENEFLSPYGIRSLSRVHGEQPVRAARRRRRVPRCDYEPGESDSGIFGGNSNWRGPVWFPLNYLLIEALERYHHFYGDTLRVECPTRLGPALNAAPRWRASSPPGWPRSSCPTPTGAAPCHGDEPRYADDPHWRDLVLFHEYFHGDTGRGLGASHQTGWTALVVEALRDVAEWRKRGR